MAYSPEMCPKSIFNGGMILKALANVFRVSVSHSLIDSLGTLTHTEANSFQDLEGC